MEYEVLTEVPEDLKRLIRYIVRGFYGVEHAIVIDMLVRNPCMNEEDMIELLKFDKKQLRSLVNTLKNDKFLKVRMRVETDADGRASRHNYYFINYKVFVNVVKYKLDHMRRKIEVEERDATNRASFKCPNCEMTFTDLEADRLFDMATMSYRCTMCRSEVEEDQEAVPKQDSRTLLAKFNEQIEPIFDLLRKCEDIRLSAAILDPEPTDIKHLTGGTSSGPKSHSRVPGTERWAGGSKGAGFDVGENRVTVEMGEQKIQEKTQKAQPVWMSKSTVQGAITEMAPQANLPAAPTSQGREPQNEIMQMLFVHEKKKDSVPVPVGASDEESSTSESDDEPEKPAPSYTSAATAFGNDYLGGSSSYGTSFGATTGLSSNTGYGASSAFATTSAFGNTDTFGASSSISVTPAESRITSFSGVIAPTAEPPAAEVEEMESDDEDDGVPMVSVGSSKVPFNEVTPEMVEKMTPFEKEAYIKLGQEMAEAMDF